MVLGIYLFEMTTNENMVNNIKEVDLGIYLFEMAPTENLIKMVK